MKKCKFGLWLITSVALVGASFSAFAQDHGVAFSSESALPGETITVTFTFTNPGGASAVEARARILDMTPFTDVTVVQNDLCPQGTADFRNCAFGDGNRIAIGLTNFDASAIDGFTGTFTMTVDPDIDPATLPRTVAIEWNSAADAGLTFTPTSTTNGQITIQSGPPAEAAIAPPSWTVASVAGGAAPSQTFTVSNAAETGQTPAAANLAIQSVALEGAPQFTRNGGTCSAGTTSLAPGASCTVIVQLSTAAIGDFTGTLRVGHSAGADLTAALTGAVRDTDAALVIEPTTFDFGELDIDAAASCRAFAISNTPGEDALTVGTATVTGAPFSVTTNTCNGTTLAGGASCSVTVCFDPAEEGAANDALVVTSDANNVSAALSGTGTATANISVNPPFSPPPVNLGAASAGETITVNRWLNAPTAVTNSGSAAATVACALQNESTAGVFSTAPSLANVEVTANSTVPFSLSCALPAAGEEGDTYTATLACNVDGQPAGTHQLSCTVTEIEPLPVPTMSNWSLAFFALLMLLVGGFSIRFFRV